MFDLPVVLTPDEEGKEQVSHDVDAATEVSLGIEDELGIDDYKFQESGGEIDDVHNEEVPLHKQEFPSCTHAPVHSYVVSDLDFFDPFLGDDISLCVENDHNCLEDINKKSDKTNWDAFMGSDTESGGEVVSVHDICGEEKDFSMVHIDHGVAPNLCFETSFELPVIPRVIKVLTHVPYPPEEDESFILHFCADEGYEDHVLPTHIREFKNLRHLMAFVEGKLEMLITSAPLQSLLFESLRGIVGQTTLKIALLGRQPKLISAFVCLFVCLLSEDPREKKSQKTGCFLCLFFCLCVLFVQLRILLWG
ncbi:unnamed protein product [Cuscuta epithymum]|uniref:Uncharacterized protein n=1 Tax=Cuscuta epithymum TaxID=186058 RepID=A0AAV0FG81_9ASTE|nr:unnamed protein product [Cuscuta epithymum]